MRESVREASTSSTMAYLSKIKTWVNKSLFCFDRKNVQEAKNILLSKNVWPKKYFCRKNSFSVLPKKKFWSEPKKLSRTNFRPEMPKIFFGLWPEAEKANFWSFLSLNQTPTKKFKVPRSRATQWKQIAKALVAFGI